jgi:hypothetical protein
LKGVAVVERSIGLIVQYSNIVGVLLLGGQKYKLEEKAVDVTEEGCYHSASIPHPLKYKQVIYVSTTCKSEWAARSLISHCPLSVRM